ncbi:hypothetical protein HK098_002344 [Nowakowskiella sp. JEL0407]|nr:hypothetical protein HK098_002344 [Nowakowskiella sp. JEL0407]
MSLRSALPRLLQQTPLVLTPRTLHTPPPFLPSINPLRLYSTTKQSTSTQTPQRQKKQIDTSLPKTPTGFFIPKGKSHKILNLTHPELVQIIGIAGTKIRAIADKSQCKIFIPKRSIYSPLTKRLVGVVGDSKENVDLAVSLIFDVGLKNNRFKKSDAEFVFDVEGLKLQVKDGQQFAAFFLDSGKLRGFVGRDGEQINQIREKSQCFVFLRNDSVFKTDKRLVTLIGSSEEIKVAEELINEAIKDLNNAVDEVSSE